MTAGEQTDHAQHDRPRAGPAPDVGETLRLLGEDGRATLRSARGTLHALRILIAADFALARGALARALVCACVAVAFGGSAWLLLMAALIAALKAFGLSWLLSMLVAALLSLAVTAIASVGALRYFKHTGMQATRRQFARLGLGALDDLMRDVDEQAHSPTPTAGAEPPASAGSPAEPRP